MNVGNLNLVEEILGHGNDEENVVSRFVLVQDTIDTSGRFVLHHLVKGLLMPKNPSHTCDALIFLAFSEPLSHYERILRKLGCNLTTQRENRRFIFLDMLQYDVKDSGSISGLSELYVKIHNIMEQIISAETGGRRVAIVIDDIMLLEIATHGKANDVLEFLHYCHVLTSRQGSSLVLLSHGDIYSDMETNTILSHLEYSANVLVKIEPIASGLAPDVHGQMTVEHKHTIDNQDRIKSKFFNFHFRVKENASEYFHPGSQISMSL